MTSGGVICDLRIVQERRYRGTTVARVAYEIAAALERERPDLVSCYLLDEALSPPGAADELATTRKLLYLEDPVAQGLLHEARVLLSLSPPEGGLGLDLLRRVGANEMSFVTVLQESRSIVAEPRTPLLRRRSVHLAREVVRGADAVLVTTPSLCRVVSEALGEPAPPCHPIGLGVARRFAPPHSRTAALSELRRHISELNGSFILCSSEEGMDELSSLVSAFALASTQTTPPSETQPSQLVVTGELSTKNRDDLLVRARREGVGDAVVYTGLVSEERLVLLYQAAELYVALGRDGDAAVALEALASGAVVAAPDSPSFADVLPVKGARFRGSEAGGMATTITRCLTDRALRSEIRAVGQRRERWEEVAARAAVVLEALSSGPPPVRRSRRRPARVAIVSPFPPMRSGVAGYSGRLVEALHKVIHADPEPEVEVDCFIDGRDRYPLTADPIVGTRPLDARLFRLADAVVNYDAVVYVLGNSEYHSNALAALRRRPGIVYTHDVRLSGLFTFALDTKGAVEEGLAATIARSYAGLPPELGHSRFVTPGEQDRYGLLLLRDVARHCERLLVSSEAARGLAELDLGPALASRLAVLPFAVSCLSREELTTVAAARRSCCEPPPFRIASFGIVDPAKRPDVLVVALSELAAGGIDAELAFVGLVSEELASELRSLACDLGIGDRVTVTGPVGRDEYLAELGKTHLAVQLRSRFFGEASAAVSECLSSGLPTVVPRIGWMTEIPEDAVRKVAADCSPVELATELAALINDPETRHSLGAAGESWAEGQTYENAAAALLGELGGTISGV